jgi:hypothetical protein
VTDFANSTKINLLKLFLRDVLAGQRQVPDACTTGCIASGMCYRKGMCDFANLALSS